MGQSIEASVGFGWIMPEDDCEWMPGHDKCVKHVEDAGTEDEWSHWECVADPYDDFEIPYDHETLETGFAGSLYAGEPQTILYHKSNHFDTYWEAKEISPADHNPKEWLGNRAPVEIFMREAAKELGITLPDKPAGWILWPCLS